MNSAILDVGQIATGGSTPATPSKNGASVFDKALEKLLVGEEKPENKLMDPISTSEIVMLMTCFNPQIAVTDVKAEALSKVPNAVETASQVVSQLSDGEALLQAFKPIDMDAEQVKGVEEITEKLHQIISDLAESQTVSDETFAANQAARTEAHLQSVDDSMEIVAQQVKVAENSAQINKGEDISLPPVIPKLPPTAQQVGTTVTQEASLLYHKTIQQNAVTENSILTENTYTTEKSNVPENSNVTGNTYVTENSNVTGNTHVTENTRVQENTHVTENSHTTENTRVIENSLPTENTTQPTTQDSIATVQPTTRENETQTQSVVQTEPLAQQSQPAPTVVLNEQINQKPVDTPKIETTNTQVAEMTTSSSEDTQKVDYQKTVQNDAPEMGQQEVVHNKEVQNQSGLAAKVKNTIEYAKTALKNVISDLVMETALDGKDVIPSEKLESALVLATQLNTMIKKFSQSTSNTPTGNVQTSEIPQEQQISAVMPNLHGELKKPITQPNAPQHWQPTVSRDTEILLKQKENLTFDIAQGTVETDATTAANTDSVETVAKTGKPDKSDTVVEKTQASVDVSDHELAILAQRPANAEAHRQIAQQHSNSLRRIVSQQIIDITTTNKINTDKTLEVELHPQHLGKILIKITSDSDGMSAKVVATSGAVREVLSQQVAQIQQNLNNMGIELRGIDISDSDAGSFEQQFSQQQQQQQQGGQTRHNTPPRPFNSIEAMSDVIREVNAFNRLA